MPRVRHTKWQEDSTARLWCPTCGYRKKGKLATVNGLAVRHAEKQGHRVQVYRSQWKAVSPITEETDA